jgi:hypothetical protein
MKRPARFFVMAATLASTALIALLPATANGADLSRPDVAASALKEPPGYTIVSQSFTATAGTQTPSIVMCPGNEVPFGGGVYVTSTSVNVNVNTSRPLITGNGWVADVNNDSSSDSGMTTYAICADKPKKYDVVQSSMQMETDGAVLIAEPYAACPSKTIVLGGGVDSSSSDLLDNIGDSSPDNKKGWMGVEVSDDENENPSPTITAYAICAQEPSGYDVVLGGTVTVPSNTQGNASALCPGKSVPISGGAESGDEWSIFVASLFPSGTQSWKVYYNNLTDNDDEFIASDVICAK